MEKRGPVRRRFQSDNHNCNKALVWNKKNILFDIFLYLYMQSYKFIKSFAKEIVNTENIRKLQCLEFIMRNEKIFHPLQNILLYLWKTEVQLADEYKGQKNLKIWVHLDNTELLFRTAVNKVK